MLDSLFRSNFRTKCKSLLSRIRTRLEVIKKRRNAMQKFLKKDIAELLKSNLERNAYGRKTGVSFLEYFWRRLESANVASMAEGLYLELNLSSCYEYVEQCCACIAENLKEMHKQSECPEQCKVAVASLTYAAARFADLPELRDLRNHFHDKYGKAVEPFVDKEFMEKLKSRPPTTQMKLWLMQEIAKEFSVTWDPVYLEQQLQTPHLPPQEKPAKVASENGASDGRHLFRNRSTLNREKGKQVDEDKQSNEEESVVTARTRRRNSCSGLKENIAEKAHEQNVMQEEKISNNGSKKPITNRIVPAPYIKSNDAMEHGNDNRVDRKQNNEDDDNSSGKAKPRPRSVRTKFLKPSVSTSSTTSRPEHEIDPRESLSARVTQARKQDVVLNDEDEEEEEEKLDKILTHFGNARKEDNETPKFDLPPPPGRRRYLFSESDQPETPAKVADSQRKSEKNRFGFESRKSTIRHVRSTSYLNDVNHVHPRMPDFDELAERVSVLKNVGSI